MIEIAHTLSIADARATLGWGWPKDHPYHPYEQDGRVRWIGFDCGKRQIGVSPLRTLYTKGGVVVECADWDPNFPQGRDEDEIPKVLLPTVELLTPVVKILRDWQNDSTPFALAVHCYAGLNRSGAVVEFVKYAWGVQEAERVSTRCRYNPPTFNQAILGMLQVANDRLSRDTP